MNKLQPIMTTLLTKIEYKYYCFLPLDNSIFGD